MRLRNKHTGEVIEACDITVNEPSVKVMGIDSVNQKGAYSSLAELNEEWEDYKPAEPLIKDEKIRKAVRAWAEATKVKSVWYDCYHHTLRNRHTQADKHIGCGEMLGGLCEDTLYTIAELCGEEEE